MDGAAGRVALVTGASSGIGEAVALALAAAGMKVAVCARRADRLDILTARINAVGEALALPGDVLDEAVATATVDKTVAHFGRIDILVNSAGVTQSGGIENADTEAYRRVIDINLLAPFYTCRAAIGPMKAQGSGDIINVSSQAGRKSAPNLSAYAVSKHALNTMTDGLRQGVGGYGIRVCTLMPGATNTEFGDSISDPRVRAGIKAHLTKEGTLDPVDVADAVMFVVSLPRRANISELSIRPTIDTSA